MGADDNAITIGRWHREVERASGLTYTILRPNGFMQNFVTATAAKHLLTGPEALSKLRYRRKVQHRPDQEGAVFRRRSGTTGRFHAEPGNAGMDDPHLPGAFRDMQGRPGLSRQFRCGAGVEEESYRL